MMEQFSYWKKDLFGTLFFLSTCLLFVMTGLDRQVYPFLYLSAFLGFCLLYRARKDILWGGIATSIWFPFPFFLYTAVTPGLLFKDLPVADIMVAAYVVGLATACFFEKTYWKFFFCLALTLTGALALYAVLGFPPDMTIDNRLVLFSHHPNVMASVAALCVLFFIANCRCFSKKWQYGLFALLTPCVLALALSAGRSAYIGFIGAGFFLGCTVWKKYISRVVVALMALCLLTYILLPEQQQQRMLSAVVNPLQDNTFKSRIPIWLVVYDGIQKSPWLGNSVRGFFAHHKRYIEEHKEKLSRDHPYTEPMIGHPHSTYLGMVYVNGIVGTLLFFLAFVPAVRRAWRENDWFFLSVLVFYLGYGLLEYSLHRKEGILLLFFPLGLVYGRDLLAALQSQPPRTDEHKQGNNTEQRFNVA